MGKGEWENRQKKKETEEVSSSDNSGTLVLMAGVMVIREFRYHPPLGHCAP